mmetsp:Transcript_34019/g.52186  ORF Transcript_34019/g.52186 Transcript_34019/m.52186 type:complete len:174 (+) Transcript_34019:680-1201(+)|eukprot:CAMPEP_0118701242 /NCGR_PEP_ID=MMETSP0800-20121206/17128_1 /TAXON_ID=210618 ORGANISM="Striatella unipunctata, Strain CCMP2910" /NCGR_SAMPLE_ID=MMETSP0800 /ASSEMBLY_ACC=CAM_ASM_000638 /LENGTH=173 /DNA_ID=CAMNT_0006602113 /DNA_START=700 /DNA_END=1221 /DNA_ORIENTATION=-
MTNNLHIQEQLIEKLEREYCDEVVDIIPIFRDYGLDMIHRNAFGNPLSEFKDRGKAKRALRTHCLILFLSVRVLPHLGLNPNEMKRNKSVLGFRNCGKNAIQEEQARQGSSKSQGDECEQDNLLSFLVGLIDKNVPFESVVDELLSFLLAGYDTSSVTLGNLIFNHILSWETP